MLSPEEFQKEAKRVQEELKQEFIRKSPAKFLDFPFIARFKILAPLFIPFFIFLCLHLFNIEFWISFIVSFLIFIIIFKKSEKLFLVFRYKDYTSKNVVITNTQETFISKIFTPFKKVTVTFKSLSDSWEDDFVFFDRKKYRINQKFNIFLGKDNNIILLTRLPNNQVT